MSRWLITIWLLLPCSLFAQVQPTPGMEQQLENITESNEDAEATDDSWLQQMEQFKNKPLNLNTATESEMQELQLLSALQIQQFIIYRNVLGKLISIYELQSIPGWDVPLIQKLLPYITVNNDLPITSLLVQRLTKGEHTILLRFSRALELAAGYHIEDTSKSYYTGDPSKVMFRYKYQYKNLLQYGITASKDAGEPLLNKKAKQGFDLYSFHVFARNIGIVKALALGDYTVNIGQGLICWQGLAFGTGSEATNIKRESAILRPYNSSGAYYFNRGAAVTMEKRKWQGTVFFSKRKLDANLSSNDTSNIDIASSIHTSGYHRTQGEIADRGTLSLLSFGANLSYIQNRWRIGMSTVQYAFGNAIQKKEVPYNKYALSGKSWNNSSLDYSFTFRNMHLFGETAIDKNNNIASVNGMLASVDRRVDLVMLHRSISPAYQSLYGNAFTTNTMPTNEKGLYTGLVLKPTPTVRVDLYSDFFRFPWLKYRVDAPSQGRHYLIQLSYKPSKKAEVYTRFNTLYKPVNNRLENNALNEVITFSNRSWRTQVNYQFNERWTIRQRFEILWYSAEKNPKEKGFLTYIDVFYKHQMNKFAINARVQYFESDSYNSRLYAYENDVLYYYAVPVFYDAGTRYYLNLKYNLHKHCSIWVKWSQTLYHNKTAIGSGLDEIEGNTKSELRLLLYAAF
jgi:hypothetical protein